MNSGPARRMHWTVAAPFSRSANDLWLAPSVPGPHDFTIIPRPGRERSWHERRLKVSGVRDWRELRRQAKRAVSETRDGVITVFPQLAALVGLERRRGRFDGPLLSWFFNTNLYGGPRRVMAARSLGQVDRFVVHTSIETTIYSEWLQLPPDRFTFVPLQFVPHCEVLAPDDDDPFVFATGSGYRDYRTLFAAVEQLGLPARVVAGPRALEGLRVPETVEILEGLDSNQIHELVQRARVNVIPMNLEGLVAGTVTIVQALRLGRAPVITRRSGIDDYIFDDQNAVTVEPHDPGDLAAAITALWDDPERRRRLNEGALAFGMANCTDEAAGAALSTLLDELAVRYGAQPQPVSR